MLEQESSRVRQVVDSLVEKGAYMVAILVGVAFLWMIVTLLGWVGFAVLILLSIFLTVFKIGFLWFLR